MANEQERVKHAASFKFEAYGKECTQVRNLSWDGLTCPVIDTTKSGDREQESSVGRARFGDVSLTYTLAASNKFMLQEACKYFENKQVAPRTTLTITEMNHDNTPGAVWNFYEAFCKDLTLPKGNAQSGMVEVKMVFSVNHGDQPAAAGQA